MKQTLVRALLSIAKLTQGFEVGLAICSPLAYVGASALTALYHSMYHLDPRASPILGPQPAQERRGIVEKGTSQRDVLQVAVPDRGDRHAIERVDDGTGKREQHG